MKNQLTRITKKYNKVEEEIQNLLEKAEEISPIMELQANNDDELLVLYAGLLAIKNEYKRKFGDFEDDINSLTVRVRNHLEASGFLIGKRDNS